MITYSVTFLYSPSFIKCHHILCREFCAKRYKFTYIYVLYAWTFYEISEILVICSSKNEYRIINSMSDHPRYSLVTRILTEEWYKTAYEKFKSEAGKLRRAHRSNCVERIDQIASAMLMNPPTTIECTLSILITTVTSAHNFSKTTQLLQHDKINGIIHLLISKT